MSSGQFSPRAARELRATAVWIAERDADAAAGFVCAATAAAERLAHQPGLARTEPRLAPPRFRFWSLRGYPYLLVPDTERCPAVVARVVHQARDLPVVLNDLWG